MSPYLLVCVCVCALNNVVQLVCIYLCCSLYFCVMFKALFSIVVATSYTYIHMYICFNCCNRVSADTPLCALLCLLRKFVG